MNQYIKFCVPPFLKEKAERMKENGLNVSQILRNFLESFPMGEKSENTTLSR